jgi:hypothetical protein
MPKSSPHHDKKGHLSLREHTPATMTLSTFHAAILTSADVLESVLSHLSIGPWLMVASTCKQCWIAAGRLGPQRGITGADVAAGQHTRLLRHLAFGGRLAGIRPSVVRMSTGEYILEKKDYNVPDDNGDDDGPPHYGPLIIASGVSLLCQDTSGRRTSVEIRAAGAFCAVEVGQLDELGPATIRIEGACIIAEGSSFGRNAIRVNGGRVLAEACTFLGGVICTGGCSSFQDCGLRDATFDSIVVLSEADEMDDAMDAQPAATKVEMIRCNIVGAEALVADNAVFALRDTTLMGRSAGMPHALLVHVRHARLVQIS